MTQPYQPRQGQPNFQRPGPQAQSDFQQPFYHQQPSYPPQSAQQRAYPPQPYPNQPLYSQVYAPLVPAPTRSPILGIVSLVLAVVGSALWGLPVYTFDLQHQYLETAADILDLPQIGLMMGGAATLFAAFTTSVIAISINAGRVWGVIALVGTFVLPKIVLGSAIYASLVLVR